MTGQPASLPPADRSAVLSDCGKYRYVLTRRVGVGQGTATFILLNPSMADATTDDPTVRRCAGFSRLWGCGRLAVLNLFAVRATDPRRMTVASDPIGPENKAWIEKTLTERGDGPVVCGWGVHGAHMEQDLTVLGWLDDLEVVPVALGVTKDGHPKHPLYARPLQRRVGDVSVEKVRAWQGGNE
jgi:hypothetical protein